MKNLPNACSKIFSIFLTLSLFVQFAIFAPISAEAATGIFTESFGDGINLSDIPDWEEHEGGTIAKSPAVAGEDSVSPDGGRFAKIAEDSNDNGSEDGWICREINATGYENLTLSYFWRGDSDSEPAGDNGIVEARNNGNGDANCGANGGWDNLQTHNMKFDSSWTTQAAFDLPNDYDDSQFLIRFRNSTSADDEYFRVDGINIAGDKIIVDVCPNTDGVQTIGPCTDEAVDICPNIDGVQIVVPQGHHHYFNGTELVCLPDEPAPGVCEVYSQTDVKVAESQIGDNISTFPNTDAVLVSTVPAIQALGAGVWQADVGNPLAKWIWSEDPYDTNWETDRWVTFEKSFNVGETPESALLNIAADNSYEVWINQATSSAPNFADAAEDNHSTVDLHDVTSLVHSGSNTIIARVKNWALSGSPKENNPGGLIFNLKIQSNQCPAGGDPEPGEPQKLQVKIYKYLDGEAATAESAGNYEFPMTATWNWPGSPQMVGSSGSGEYVLGLLGHGGGAPYQAYTSVMNAPVIYQTHELTSDIFESSRVLPIGAACEEGMFRLLGYRVGDSESSALSAELSANYPDFTNLSADKYVIVENETCPTVLPPPQIVSNEEIPLNQSGGHRRDFSIESGEVLGASTEGPVCEPYMTKYIKFGADNDPEEVKKLQIFLNQFFETDNPVTGFYGPVTLEWVKKFQEHQRAAVLTPWAAAGLPTDGPTGYAYKTTLRWINILKCPGMIASTPIPDLP